MPGSTASAAGGSTAWHEFVLFFAIWRKWGPEILKFVGILAKSRLGSMWEVRSTPKTTDPWIKTTKNSTNLQIEIRAIFWGKFSEKILGEIGGGGVKFVATLGC